MKLVLDTTPLLRAAFSLSEVRKRSSKVSVLQWCTIENHQDPTLREVLWERNESSYRGGAHSVPTSSSNRKLRFPQRNPMAGMSSSEQCTIRAAKRTVGDNDNT